MSYKYRIIIVASIYILILGALFGFVYGWVDSGNDSLALVIDKQNKDYSDQLAEQRSYEAGTKDLEVLAKKAYQPDNFFSKDTRVVKEIKQLEEVSQDLDIDLKLTVSGTVSEATKANQTAGEIYVVPYTMQATGRFESIVSFLEIIEQLPFVTHVKSLSISALGSGQVNALISANFFIKK